MLFPLGFRNVSEAALQQCQGGIDQDTEKTYEAVDFIFRESFEQAYTRGKKNPDLEEIADDTQEEEQTEILVYDGKKSYYYIRKYDKNTGEYKDVSEYPVCNAELLQAIASQHSFLELRNKYFTVDSSTGFPEGIVTVEELLGKNYSIEKGEKPQILIFHTHSAEAYADSRKGNPEDSVVGVGSYLASLLEERGYRVIHDTSAYDYKDGVVNRDVAYSQALRGLTSVLEEYPSIEVIIDLHRDSGAARTVEINNQKTAQIMLFNGMCRTPDGPIDYLQNKNLADNLGFSLQCKIIGDSKYPGFMKRNYLKSYRYNMHLRPRDLLVEVGTGKNTVAEAYAAMVPFAEILDSILSEND